MSDSDETMRTYYRQRAPVYDRVYSPIPSGIGALAGDLRYLETCIPEALAGLDVLEIAAGTGYWTAHISGRARTVTATDVTVEALDRISERRLPGNVRIEVVDAYAPGALGKTFNGAFLGLWFSHVPIERRREFIEALHCCLADGAVVVMLDNSTAQCERLPITHTDSLGNIYQDRITDTGDTHRVLKNFPAEQELVELVGDAGRNCEFLNLEHFWLFRYEVERT